MVTLKSSKKAVLLIPKTNPKISRLVNGRGMCDTRTTKADELTHISSRKICLYYYSLVVRLVVDSYVYSNGSQPDVYGGDSQGHSFSTGSQGSGQTDSTREKKTPKKMGEGKY
jgi:hypothetical protein